VKELEELQLYIGMNSIPKSWKICYKNARENFRKDWLADFDFKEILGFYNLQPNFTRNSI